MYTVIAIYKDRRIVNRHVPNYELALKIRDLHYGNGAYVVEFRKE